MIVSGFDREDSMSHNTSALTVGEDDQVQFEVGFCDEHSKRTLVSGITSSS